MNFFPILFLGIGLYLLAKGADFLVRGAVSLAQKLRLSQRTIGLTVVSFGTTMPEFLVNTVSSWVGHPSISLGNVLGTNIVNTLLILGVAAVIRPIRIAKKTIYREIPLNLFVVAFILFMVNDSWFGDGANILSKLEGLLLVLLFFSFLFTTFTSQSPIRTAEKIKELPLRTSFWFTGLGFALLAMGTYAVINGAIDTAQWFGLSESVIGLTIVAIGTSLPELATAISAARRKNSEIIVGNVIGANIFNLCWILGISAILTPIPLGPFLGASAVYAPIATAIFLAAAIHGRKRRTLEKKEGVLFLALYFFFLVLLFYTAR